LKIFCSGILNMSDFPPGAFNNSLLRDSCNL
jgi:hypothetical protein